MSQLIEEFQDIFQAPKELPLERAFDHAIHLKPLSKPVNVKPYCYPYFQKAEVERQVQQLLEQKALNAITIKDKIPIPTVEELFDELEGTQFFSKLDLLSGYHQIRVRASDVPKMAFRTYEGHYKFLVMPFGLTNAPSTVQATMNEYFWMLYSGSWQEHLNHVKLVLARLRECGLVTKASKCMFGQEKVEYLGHLVTREGLAVDPQKIEAIKVWPQLSGVKGVTSFLRITGYYRKFIKGFASIAAPLFDLLCKGASFTWIDTAHKAFEKLKQFLCTLPVL
ncbi:hypothetical protein CXB51_025242 [Gossypium anomalum]|uniref:Reverse transcriptase domain-containing protein n=1 Tax=Gossypium anomalum TaxID=47600 RepID=A0A8J5Y1K9_9ROSI|nr:hypothetical protein CXB51_025242 [Gossypium anomalum]